jgi:PAS domain S-box-containing protein
MFAGNMNLVYMSVLRMSPEAIVVSTPDGRVSFANEKAAELFGYDNFQQMNDINSFQLLAEKDRPKAQENMMSIMKGERNGREEVEYALLRKDGSEFTGMINNSFIEDNLSKKPLMFITVVREVQEKVCPECGYKCRE